MSKAEEVVLPVLAERVKKEHPRLSAGDIAKLIQNRELQLTCNGKKALIAVQTRYEHELPTDGFYAPWREREERVHVFILFPQGASAECQEKAMRIANQTYASLGTVKPTPISIRVAVDEDGKRNFILKLP